MDGHRVDRRLAMLDAACMSAAEPSKECNVLGNTEVWTGEASSQVWPEMSVCPKQLIVEN